MARRRAAGGGNWNRGIIPVQIVPPRPSFEPYTVIMRGGLDRTTPPIERYRNPGGPIRMVNYVISEEGYELVSGYTKFREQPVPGVGPIYAIAQHEGQTTGVYVFRRKTDQTLGVYRAATNYSGAWIPIEPEAGTLTGGIEPPPPGERVRWVSRSFAANSEPTLYFVTGAGPNGIYVVTDEGAGEFVRGVDVGLESETTRPDAQRYPRFIEAHQDHLFVGYRGGSLIWSALGKPLDFSAIIGAGEAAFKNIGGQMAGLQRGFQRRLWIFGVDGIHLLEGSSAETFDVRSLSEEMGAAPDTMQLADSPFYFSNEGVRQIGVGGESGFATDTVSRKILPLVEELLSGGVRTTTSMVLRDRGQYRVYMDDKTAIVACRVARDRDEGGISWEFTTLEYPKSVTVASNVPTPRDQHGHYHADRALIALGRETEDAVPANRQGVSGDEPDGYVYRDGPPPEGGGLPEDFDGTPIHGLLHFGLNRHRRPHVMKRYRNAEFEATGKTPFRMGVVFGAGGESRMSSGKLRSVIGTVPGRPASWASRYDQPVSRWNEMVWNDGRWSAVRVGTGQQGDRTTGRVRAKGRGVGFELLFSTKYASDAPAPPPHVLTAFGIYWKSTRQTPP